MAGEVERSEKIVNLGPADLGQIDLLVQEGANRTDFIRTAIRTQLAARALGRRTDGRPQGPDASPDLALDTISAVEVLGAFRAGPAVKAALAPRTV
jgi:Arc/MetJ-type ribon-helix-helix transcriptional regulator